MVIREFSQQPVTPRNVRSNTSTGVSIHEFKGVDECVRIFSEVSRFIEGAEFEQLDKYDKSQFTELQERLAMVVAWDIRLNVLLPGQGKQFVDQLAMKGRQVQSSSATILLLGALNKTFVNDRGSTALSGSIPDRDILHFRKSNSGGVSELYELLTPTISSDTKPSTSRMQKLNEEERDELTRVAVGGCMTRMFNIASDCKNEDLVRAIRDMLTLIAEGKDNAFTRLEPYIDVNFISNHVYVLFVGDGPVTLANMAKDILDLTGGKTTSGRGDNNQYASAFEAINKTAPVKENYWSTDTRLVVGRYLTAITKLENAGLVEDRLMPIWAEGKIKTDRLRVEVHECKFAFEELCRLCHIEPFDRVSSAPACFEALNKALPRNNIFDCYDSLRIIAAIKNKELSSVPRYLRKEKPTHTTEGNGDTRGRYESVRTGSARTEGANSSNQYSAKAVCEDLHEGNELLSKIGLTHPFIIILSKGKVTQAFPEVFDHFQPDENEVIDKVCSGFYGKYLEFCIEQDLTPGKPLEVLTRFFDRYSNLPFVQSTRSVLESIKNGTDPLYDRDGKIRPEGSKSEQSRSRKYMSESELRNKARIHYETLGLMPGCTRAELEQKYRKLAIKYHPDTNPSAGNEFKSIALAYKWLQDKIYSEDGNKLDEPVINMKDHSSEKTGAVITVSQDNFNNEVLSSKYPVLVDFYADWCGPCRRLAPVLESAASQFKGKAKVVKVNIDDNPDLYKRYKDDGIPLLVVFRDGKVQEKSVGALSQDGISRLINSCL